VREAYDGVVDVLAAVTALVPAPEHDLATMEVA
jgi:hypothetical protein